MYTISLMSCTFPVRTLCTSSTRPVHPLVHPQGAQIWTDGLIAINSCSWRCKLLLSAMRFHKVEVRSDGYDAAGVDAPVAYLQAEEHDQLR